MIPDSGKFAGASCWLLFGGTFRAFLWENGTQVDFGTLGQRSAAQSINDAGSVVGYSDIQPNQFHAFIWSKAAGMKDLGLPGLSGAAGINNQGSVVGVIGYADTRFLRTAAGITQDVPGTGTGDARALNDKDEVVGWHSTTMVAFPGFLGSGGKVTDLPSHWTPSAVNSSGTVSGTPLPGDTNSFGRGINDQGVTVGGSFIANGQPLFGRAVVWSGGTPTDLNLLAVNRPVIKMHFCQLDRQHWNDCRTRIGKRRLSPLHRAAGAVPSVGPNLAFNGAYLNVLGDIPAGGSGVVITPSGHVIPWPPPTPMSRLMSEINTELDSGS